MKGVSAIQGSGLEGFYCILHPLCTCVGDGSYCSHFVRVLEMVHTAATLCVCWRWFILQPLCACVIHT
jgi:hypothetical protein